MKNSRIKIVAFILCLVTVIGAFAVSSVADMPSVPDTSNAKYVSLYNVNTGKIIYSKNTNHRMFPGSAVKMMTGLIACELLEDRLDEKVDITESMIGTSQGWNVKLAAGMTVTVEDLLYGVLCGCGNDAALALATLCSGSISGFVDDMNTKAQELGMKSTYFTNPTGLDDSDMYSTLSDIMLVAKEAVNNELYLDISTAMSYVYKPQGYDEEIKFFNRNSLISNFYALGYRNLYAYGLIAGNTELGGYCAITYAEKNDTGYICAVMDAEATGDTIYSYEIVNSLLDFAFDNYSYIRIAEKGKRICTAKTKFAMPTSAEEQTVSCIVSDDIYALTYMEIDPEKDLEYNYYLHNETLNAPISAGMIVGGADIIYEGEVIGSAVLVAEEDIEASGILLNLEKLRSFFMGRFFWTTVVFTIVGLFFYFRMSLLRFRKGKRKSNNNIKRFY